MWSWVYKYKGRDRYMDIYYKYNRYQMRDKGIDKTRQIRQERQIDNGDR